MLRGRLEAPPSDLVFDYRRYLASQGVGSLLTDARVEQVDPHEPAGLDLDRLTGGVRRRAADAIAGVLPEPQASLTQALLLGLRGGLHPEVTESFRHSGAAHLLAISGMHVGVLLLLALQLSRTLFGRRYALYLLLPLLLIWGYTGLAGAPPSAVRAAVMGSAYLLALASGRGASPLNALALAVLGMLAWDPRLLWQVSFQLSFASMAGHLLIGLPLWERMRSRMFGDTGGRRHTAIATVLTWAGGGLLVSFGAILGSLPIVALQFGQVPIIGAFTTLLLLPVLPALIVGGGTTALLAVLWAPLGYAAGWVPLALGAYAVGVTQLLGTIPFAVAEVRPGAGFVWAYYGVLVAMLALMYRQAWQPGVLGQLRLLWRVPGSARYAGLVILGMAVLAAVPWSVAVARTDGNLHVYFLDVGQGDATLLRTPGGANLLIDGGPNARDTLRLVDERTPFGRQVIDVAVLTHPQADHINGLLALARRQRLKLLLVPPPVSTEDVAWRRELDQAGVNMVIAVAGASVSFADGTRLDVIHPPASPLVGTSSDANNNSLVMLVRYGESQLLFPGDAEIEAEWVMLDGGASLAADVLKLGHHGSDSSSSADFLAAVAPAVAVVSAGEDNRFGHPSPAVLERVASHVPPALIFDTARQGSIELTTDGQRWWVSTKHRPPVRQPPVRQPPVRQPPVRQPPVRQPPVRQPPVRQPPVRQPPVRQPPVRQPPVRQPPVRQPPVRQPPVRQPPVRQPPVRQPPVRQPPVRQP